MLISVWFLSKEMEAAMVDGNGTETGHIIVTTIGGKNGQPKQVKMATLFLSGSTTTHSLCYQISGGNYYNYSGIKPIV